jgi:hypothetical protein
MAQPGDSARQPERFRRIQFGQKNVYRYVFQVVYPLILKRGLKLLEDLKDYILQLLNGNGSIIEELDGPAVSALRRAIAEVKQRWSVMRWVTTNAHWARVVGYGPFPIRCNPQGRHVPQQWGH